MSTAIIPRLRHDAVVRPFDDRGSQPRYVIAIDGHHFVVTPTVAAVLDETRQLQVGEDDFGALAARLHRRLGRSPPCSDLARLLNDHVPRSLLEAGETPHAASPIALRRLLLSPRLLHPALDRASRLFSARVAAPLLAIALMLETCLAAREWGLAAAIPPAESLVCAFALTILGAFCHELGHLAACRRFGGAHGGIGVGVYWFMPAFYAEVHGAWLLPRIQRAVIDVGGVYFQALFVAGMTALHLCFPSVALASAIAWSHLLMLHTLNPILKFDGYWLLCDLSGAHNLHRDVRNIAARLLWRQWPTRREAALLAAFALIATLYFTYVLNLLGGTLGSTAGELRQVILLQSLDARALTNIVIRAALLAMLVAMSVGLAFLLSRAGAAVLAGPQASSLAPNGRPA
jgi:putative peptide zinc metalloprotease protein